jgi:hypothetical protein
MGAAPILISPLNRGDRGKVEASGRASQGAIQSGRVACVGSHQDGGWSEIADPSGRKIIEYAHVVPLRQECIGEVRADEPGATCDQEYAQWVAAARARCQRHIERGS